MNATDQLKILVLERNWHKGKIERRLAAVTKQNLLKGKLSYEKACEILKLLGWEKVHDEDWSYTNNGTKISNINTNA